MKKYLISLVLLIGILSTSCSRDNESLLETVPEDAEIVVVADASAIADKLSIKVADGKLTLPESIASRVPRISDDALTEIGQFVQAVDMKCIVLFGNSDDDPIVTFTISDENLFEKLTEDRVTGESRGFRLIAASGGASIATKDGQGWILRSSDPAAEIKEILSEVAKSKSIADVKSIDDALRQAAPVRFIRHLGDGRWAAGNISLTANDISANLRIIKADGSTETIPGLQTLSTDFLRYAPASANFAAAIGATADTDWQLLGKATALIADPQLHGMLDTLMPYFRKADGTVAIAANVDVADPAASGSHFLLMIHMPQPDIDEALGEIRAKMQSMGVVPHTDNSGIISAGAPGYGIFAGTVDGHLAISSKRFSPVSQSELSSFFLNRKGAAVLKLNGIPLLGISSPLTLSAKLRQDDMTIKISTPGGIASLLGTFLAMAI